jgi:hypothetical protein
VSRSILEAQRFTRCSFCPQMSQFVTDFRAAQLGGVLAPPPAPKPSPRCRRRVAALLSSSRTAAAPPPKPHLLCRACSAAVAVGGGSNAAARCKPPACSACSALACATRVPHAASLPMRLPLPLVTRHMYRPCTAAQFARAKVLNSPPLQPRLVFLFHAAC